MGAEAPKREWVASRAAASLGRAATGVQQRSVRAWRRWRRRVGDAAPSSGRRDGEAAASLQQLSGAPAMKAEIRRNGPIACGFLATPRIRDEYTGGVYSETLPDNDSRMNHVVSVVGWGQDAQSNEYWVVRNSYGEQHSHRMCRQQRAPPHARVRAPCASLSRVSP